MKEHTSGAPARSTRISGNTPVGLPASWDEFDAYVFDLDGTILNCADAVHYFAFCEIISTVAGRQLNLDGITTHGSIDGRILHDALTLAAVDPENWRPHLSRLCDELCDLVEKNKASLCVKPLPRARDLLIHLQQKGGLLWVATGNLDRIGKLKLAAAGLLEFFQHGTWSNGFQHRNDVFRQAVAQIRAHFGRAASILAFGDTPADIAAACANDIPIVAVATGIYSYEQLTAESPSLCVRSFAELFDLTRSTMRSNSVARCSDV